MILSAPRTKANHYMNISSEIKVCTQPKHIDLAESLIISSKVNFNLVANFPPEIDLSDLCPDLTESIYSQDTYEVLTHRQIL